MAILRGDKRYRLKNQSETHQQLSEMSTIWISNKSTGKGSKGGIELAIPNWGVADAVVIQSFQNGFQREFNLPGYEKMLLVFETKVSLSDFKNIYKKINKNQPFPGNLNWIVSAKNLIKEKDLPEGWGLLEPYGPGLRQIVKPKYQIKCDSEINILKVESIMLWDSRWYRDKLKLIPCPECGKRRIKK